MENRLVNRRLYIPVEANPRFETLSLKESEGRIIGGDMADLRFWGYTVQGGRTMLNNPELLRGDFTDWSDEEIANEAHSILMEAYASIGAECIEHN